MNPNVTEKKKLVVFFSRTDENYGVGYITKGNTHIVTEILASETGADLFQIEPVESYPAEYDRCIEIAQQEKNAAFTKYFPQVSATGAYLWNQKEKDSKE